MAQQSYGTYGAIHGLFQPILAGELQSEGVVPEEMTDFPEYRKSIFFDDQRGKLHTATVRCCIIEQLTEYSKHDMEQMLGSAPCREIALSSKVIVTKEKLDRATTKGDDATCIIGYNNRTGVTHLLAFIFHSPKNISEPFNLYPAPNQNSLLMKTLA